MISRIELMNKLGINSIFTISSPALWTNVTFLHKTGEEIIISIKDDPYYIGHKDMLEEAINNYLNTELSKLREAKINGLL